MSPEPTEDLLSAYLDGELEPAERVAVEARLTASPEWRAVLEEIRAARAALRGAPAREAPPGFWDDVLHTGPGASRSVPATVRPARGRTPWLAAGAAAAAVLVAVAFVPKEQRVKPDVAAVSAQHGAQLSDAGDPIGALAQMARPVRFR